MEHLLATNQVLSNESQVIPMIQDSLRSAGFGGRQNLWVIESNTGRLPKANASHTGLSRLQIVSKKPSTPKLLT
jgi:hypothetical protein